MFQQDMLVKYNLVYFKKKEQEWRLRKSDTYAVAEIRPYYLVVDTATPSLTRKEVETKS